MSRIDARLAELGSPLPELAKPVAAYVPAVVTGNLVFTSGQLPLASGSPPATVTIRATHSPAPGKYYSPQCPPNAPAPLE